MTNSIEKNCKQCNSRTKNPAFCSKKCAATYNNKIYPKRKLEKSIVGTCCHCNNNFRYNPGSQAGKYCSNICQQNFQKNQRIKEWMLGGRKPGEIALREYLTEVQGYQCSCCKINKWNGNTILLEVDHIDGNPYNDRPSNLRFICPNCHSQTSTYKARNRGNGRLSRSRKKQITI